MWLFEFFALRDWTERPAATRYLRRLKLRCLLELPFLALPFFPPLRLNEAD